MIPMPDNNRFRIWPYAPFTEPLPVPTSDPNTGDLACIFINPEYIPYILGALEVYRYEDSWNADGRAAAHLAISRINLLMNIFAAALGDCPMIEDIRYNDCGLEKQVDGEWEVIPNARFVPLTGLCAMTGGLEINSTETNIPVINATGPQNVMTRLRTTDPNYQAYYEMIYNANGNGYRVGMSAGTGPGFFIYNIGTNIYFIRTNGANTAIGPSTNSRLSTEDTTTATLIVRDYRAAGITKQVTRAATAQSSNNLHEYQDSAGAIMASISSAGAATFRNQMLLRGLPATGSAVDMARLYTVFNSNAFSTYTAKAVIAASYYGGEQAGIAVEANPAGVRLKFFDATAPVAKPTVTGERHANPAVASVLAALSGLGLITDSTTVGTSGQITSVIVNTLAAGEDATADFNSATGVLTLGIPAGETGPQGEPGECPDCGDNPGPPDEPPSDGVRCGVAVGLTQWVKSIHDDTLTQLGAVTDIGQVILAVGGLITGGVTAGIALFVEAIQSAGAGVVEIENNIDFWEGVQCNLYCLLDNSGAVDSMVISAWSASLDPLNEVGNIPVRALIENGITLTEFQRRAYIYAKSPSSICELCDCPCDIYDAPAIEITEASAVTSGQTIDITATGTWNHGGGPFGPDGDTATTAGAGFPLEGVAKYCLIARIDTGAWFYVGEGGSFAASATGTLELAMNDDILYDNSGSLSVEICVS